MPKRIPAKAVIDVLLKNNVVKEVEIPLEIKNELKIQALYQYTNIYINFDCEMEIESDQIRYECIYDNNDNQIYSFPKEDSIEKVFDKIRYYQYKERIIKELNEYLLPYDLFKPTKTEKKDGATKLIEANPNSNKKEIDKTTIQNYLYIETHFAPKILDIFKEFGINIWGFDQRAPSASIEFLDNCQSNIKGYLIIYIAKLLTELKELRSKNGN